MHKVNGRGECFFAVSAEAEKTPTSTALNALATRAMTQPKKRRYIPQNNLDTLFVLIPSLTRVSTNDGIVDF